MEVKQNQKITVNTLRQKAAALLARATDFIFSPGGSGYAPAYALA